MTEEELKLLEIVEVIKVARVLCEVCGAAEGEIPTDCPGRKMTADEKERVFHGSLDYKNGKWLGIDPAMHPGKCS